MSLVPSPEDDEQRRTLLMIYIHGFMGNDASFHSFPAHVHHFLEETLANTHVVHTKIYPRYKTYKAIDVARDNFSKWLEPHESPETDVILLGHSMGGLLSADIVLMPASSGYPFRHRILGTISLDAPFLGLHPGVIVSGIASIFRPAPSPPGETNYSGSPTPSSLNARETVSPEPSILSGISSERLSSLSLSPSPLQSRPSGSDPFFNPPFFNDVPFQDRGWIKNVVHFANKHRSENLFEAAGSHIMSHLEFGACLGDYPALNSRYSRLRQLEDVKELGAGVSDARPTARVRFANYYTLSTGREKKPKPAPASPNPEPDSAGQESQISSPTSLHPKSESPIQETQASSVDIDQRASTPRSSGEEHSDDGMLQYVEPMPEEDGPVPEEGELPPAYTENADTKTADTAPSDEPPDDLQLPAIPDLPEPPVAPELDQHADKAIQKQVEKEAKRARKVYDQAVKQRDKAIKERQKLVDKHKRQLQKDAERRDKEQQKEARRREKEAQKRQAAEKQAWQDELDSRRSSNQQREEPDKDKDKEKKKKDRKFCMLPRDVSAGRDPAWVPVRMDGVDEVGAHCGLFLAGPHYEGLVVGVGTMVGEWVRESRSQRTAGVEG
ncbi:hypothetical protein QBC33DRAFT_512155 [Phialemonium atrogriseum]|uniref:DUF676 domain-containing protein n=1 Tax=Phialemonium atrogriseum TaxID=1093897 RepID=A0AAJ0C586_9PEZI|nr:uncharacterized protein QBC33DRAFT_512155 [Phialemonium atrogriseum]KAK1770393.1 hypothetical protein QBC33DRAFT_512155 [Phialemonium atrogriseum]